jgi:YHS domain-containing protein
MLAVALTISGCGASPSPDAKPEAAAAAVKPDKLPAGLAELSEADRALALKQKVCPVSGELLGSMGKPFKVTVKGQTFFLCCDGCQDDLKKDPDKYLAKLKK